ncbi:prepilin-type N-terminal cleavage/methylation domain-containing protein [Kandleria vitulina]|uniref:prepilin-type N-terminal cleavage/methylation domain-containing protein n=1 Tax=Kandleria vitulina TaxID=1630 RepID=UPI00068913D5|nr:prepilin-type N-terminal cleavage/methylation domain-containing protein [Kandleria vitulina]
MFKKLKNKKGFTLIEIIVVIVILAVLMAVAVPSVMSYMNEGKNAKFQTVGRAVLINAQTEYAKAVADGETTTAKATAESKVVAKHDYNGATVTNVTITLTNDAKSDAAEKDVTNVTCKITVDGNTKDVTIDTNKKVTVK